MVACVAAAWADQNEAPLVGVGSGGTGVHGLRRVWSSVTCEGRCCRGARLNVSLHIVDVSLSKARASDYGSETSWGAYPRIGADRL